jgi:hypothetical protein
MAMIALRFGIAEETDPVSDEISYCDDSDSSGDFDENEFDNRTSNFREERAKDMRTNRKILKGIESTLNGFIKNQKFISSKYGQNFTKLFKKTDKIAKEFKNLAQVLEMEKNKSQFILEHLESINIILVGSVCLNGIFFLIILAFVLCKAKTANQRNFDEWNVTPYYETRNGFHSSTSFEMSRESMNYQPNSEMQAYAQVIKIDKRGDLLS